MRIGESVRDHIRRHAFSLLWQVVSIIIHRLLKHLPLIEAKANPEEPQC